MENQRVISTMVLMILFFGFVGWFFLTASKQNNVQLTASCQTQQGAGKVAYKMGEKVFESRDIWLSNPDGSCKQRLTNTGHIDSLYSWSPDNRFILASTIEVGQNSAKVDYVIVDTQSGKETTIPIHPSFEAGRSNLGENSNPVWTGNNEITYINQGVVYKITTDGQKKEVNRLPTSTKATFYLLNKYANKIAFDNWPEDAEVVNVFVYDFATKQKIQISKGGHAYVLGWAGDNDVVYHQGKELWRSSADGKNKKKLIDLREEDWFVFDIALSQDGNKIFFAVKPQSAPEKMAIFVYDSMTNKLDELARFDNSTVAENLSISRDNSFGAYVLRSTGYPVYYGLTVTVNFTTKEISKLCESSCYYPIWQN